MVVGFLVIEVEADLECILDADLCEAAVAGRLVDVEEDGRWESAVAALIDAAVDGRELIDVLLIAEVGLTVSPVRFLDSTGLSVSVFERLCVNLVVVVVVGFWVTRAAFLTTFFGLHSDRS